MKFDFAFVEASVDTPIELIEGAVDLIEAAVDFDSEVIQPLIGPALSHRLHDAILEDNTFRFGGAKLKT